MKALITAVAMLAVAAPAAATAQSFDTGSIVKIGHKAKHHGKGHGRHHGWDDRDERRAYRHGYRDGRWDNRHREHYRPGYSYGYVHPQTYGYSYGHPYGYGYQQPRWYRGAVLPYEYRRYPVYNYYDYGWGAPPRGHAYYRTNTGEIVLAAIATGIIISILTN